MDSRTNRASAQRGLWRISIFTVPDSEEAVTELLARVLACPVTSFHELANGVCRVEAYLDSKPRHFAALRANLRAGLRQLASYGLALGSARIFCRRIRWEDWAESWKRHFQPLVIGRRLLIQPTWTKRRPRAGELLVRLDPGLSFGTGHHPTTVFCLEQIVAARRLGQAQALLDAGTGSGILAIAAAKLGYRPVHAFDFDADAVQIALANGRLNRVARKIQFRQRDLSRLPRRAGPKYDVVCANLVSSLLIAQRRRVTARLANGGLLVLAGILHSEFRAVRAAYEELGLELAASAASGEWRSGSFRRLQVTKNDHR